MLVITSIFHRDHEPIFELGKTAGNIADVSRENFSPIGRDGVEVSIDDEHAVILGRLQPGDGYIANLSARPVRITFWKAKESNEMVVGYYSVGPKSNLLLPRETIEVGISRDILWAFEVGKRTYSAPK